MGAAVHKILLSLLSASLLWVAAPAFAQTPPGLVPLSATPDIAVTGSATADIALATPINYIYLKNDCSTALYFDLAGRHHGGQGIGTPEHYNLRLGANEEFYGAVRSLVTLAASPASAGGSCTFTLVGYR